jgi:hypothetical protein
MTSLSWAVSVYPGAPPEGHRDDVPRLASPVTCQTASQATIRHTIPQRSGVDAPPASF